MNAIGLEQAQRRLLRSQNVDADSIFVTIPAVRGPVHVLRGGEGPPVVLVPGFADPAAMWTPLMARLDGFGLFALDRPSFGLSGPAPHTPATFRRLAVDFLTESLDALEIERAILVGNSMGSAWSTWFALEHPDRVSGLAHLGCPAFWLGTSAPAPMHLLALPLLGRLLAARPPSPEQVIGFGRRIAGEDLSSMPELVDLLVAAEARPGAGRAVHGLLRAVLRPGGARPQVSTSRRELARLRPPVVLIWGSEDRFGGPRVAREAAATIPEAELHLIPGGGHLPWIGRPDAIAEVLIPVLRRGTTGTPTPASAPPAAGHPLG